MDRLPEQHLDSLPDWKRSEVYRQIGSICAFRSKSLWEDEVAKKARFDSVEDMYFRLKRWGLSGLVPLEKEALPNPPAPEGTLGQKARSSSQPEELPMASTAADLFKEAIDGLGRVVENLDHLSLYYQGGRFAGTYEFVGREVFLRSQYSEQKWRELCERYGRDPDANSFNIDDAASKRPQGASPYPPRDLVALIATYALSDRPMEPLMEVLYPEHSQENVEEVTTLLNQTKRQKNGKDGLRRTAQQFAAAVYGHKVGKGAPVPSPPRDHLLACYITERREADIADEKIHQEIRDKGYELSKEDFNRLANLGLRFSNI